MKSNEFLELIDESLSEMQESELRYFISNFARKIPSMQYPEFIAMLRHSNTSKTKTNPLQETNTLSEVELRDKVNELLEKFSRIESGELTIEVELNEDYHDYYNRYDDEYDEEEYLYDDPGGIGDTFDTAYRLMQKAILEEHFAIACDLFDMISKTQIVFDTEWDCDVQNVTELCAHDISIINLDNLALLGLYATYQNVPNEKRAASIYQIFSHSFMSNIKVEDMITVGNHPLNDLSEFWDSWVNFLSQKRGRLETRLLKDAILYHRGEEGILEVAKQACENHPSLYLDELKRLKELGDSKQILVVGPEALDNIDRTYIIRSDIARITAEAATILNDQGIKEHCLYEALVSSTTPYNYLRYVAECDDSESKTDEIRSLVESLPDSDDFGSHFFDGLSLNGAGEVTKDILRFLLGDFDQAIFKCSEVRSGLGWSFKFVKPGVRLFLLLLLKGDTFSDSIRNNASSLFSLLNLKYPNNPIHDQEPDGMNVVDYFWNDFTIWKSKQSITDRQRHTYLKLINSLINMRVKEIVSNQKRSYYGDVANLIGSVGEVKESLGLIGSKQLLLQHYRSEFPRHSSFIQQLKANGMV